MPRVVAQSSMAVASAPDCVTKASVPGSELQGAKLALSCTPEASAPMQFGPRMRSRYGRAASSMACSSVWPVESCASRRPADSTMTARVPLAPSAATSEGTVAAGVQITASSGTPGKESMSGHSCWPATSPPCSPTAQTGPLKPPPCRLRSTMAPTLPARLDTPNTATERGEKSDSR